MSGKSRRLAMFLRIEEAATAAEYALIVAVVGATIAGAAYFLGSAISDAMNRTATCISTEGKTC